MGTSFRRHFEDDMFSGVIRTSAARLFAFCLADLTIFAVAVVRSGEAMAGDKMSDEMAVALARHCFEEALSQGVAAEDRDHLPDGIFETFHARVAETDWDTASDGETSFRGSARALIDCAPVVDEFKDLDREIVTNSIRFRWRDVRETCRRRVDGKAIVAQWGQLTDC